MIKRIQVVMFVVLVASCTHHSEIPKGDVLSNSISSEVLDREVAYNMYVPHGEMKNIQNEPHILYLLHGHGGDHNDWFEKEEGNVAQLLDSLIDVKAIPPLVAVSADAGNSWYVDSVEAMETFYTTEFMDHIETNYGLSDPVSRVIAGNSAGGYGALRFSLKDPGSFGSVILLSPASYEPLPPEVSSSRKVEAFAVDGQFNDSIWSSYSYRHLLDTFLQKDIKPKYYLSVGDDDNYNIVPVVTRLQQLFLMNEVPNELRVTDGGHDWETWKKSFVEALTAIYDSEVN